MAHLKNEGTEILRVLCGSRAYGLEDETSDFDYHGVYVVPTSRLLSIGYRIKESTYFDGEGSNQDNTAWELRHFLELALQCNPTVLETFVAPVKNATDLGRFLRTLFPYVLNKKRIYDAFRGYAHQQRLKMFDGTSMVKTENNYRRMRKAAIAYLRSLYHGEQLLRCGAYEPYIPDGEIRHFLRSLRQGEPQIHEVIEIAQTLEAAITTAYHLSELPTEPDLDRVNAFLLRVRQEMWI